WRIQRLFQQHRGTYGSPRIQRALRAEGYAVSRRRVARLMRTAGLRSRVVQIYRANPRLHRFYGQHPNRLWTRVATRPNRIWVGDITYLRGGAVALSGRRAGPVLAPRARVGARADPRRARNSHRPRCCGPAPAAASRARLPQRSRQRVRRPSVPRPLAGARDSAERHARRHAGRQRTHGVVLSLAEGRGGARCAVRDGTPAPARAAPLFSLLQSPEATLRPRLSCPSRV